MPLSRDMSADCSNAMKDSANWREQAAHASESSDLRKLIVSQVKIGQRDKATKDNIGVQTCQLICVQEESCEFSQLVEKVNAHTCYLK